MGTESMQKVAAGLIFSEEGRLLIVQRGMNKTLAGQWHLPGGKVNDGESLVDCLKRELVEELGLIVNVGTEMANLVCKFPHGTYDLHFFRIIGYAGLPKILTDENHTFEWVYEYDLDEGLWLPFDFKIAQIGFEERRQH